MIKQLANQLNISIYLELFPQLIHQKLVIERSVSSVKQDETNEPSKKRFKSDRTHSNDSSSSKSQDDSNDKSMDVDMIYPSTSSTNQLDDLYFDSNNSGSNSSSSNLFNSDKSFERSDQQNSNKNFNKILDNKSKNRNVSMNVNKFKPQTKPCPNVSVFLTSQQPNNQVRSTHSNRLIELVPLNEFEINQIYQQNINLNSLNNN